MLLIYLMLTLTTKLGITWFQRLSSIHSPSELWTTLLGGIAQKQIAAGGWPEQVAWGRYQGRCL